VGFDSDVATFASDIRDDGLESLEVRGIECTSDASCRGAKTFQHEGDTECVHSFAHEKVD
jgi:hypothetical protein